MVDRPAANLAFGYGAHACLGQLESRVLWEELLPRLKGVELTGNPRFVSANFISSVRTLPIRCHIAPDCCTRSSAVRSIKYPSSTRPG
jgi:hypothetical protein